MTRSYRKEVKFPDASVNELTLKPFSTITLQSVPYTISHCQEQIKAADGAVDAIASAEKFLS